MCLKLGLTVVVVTMVVLPLAWGYRQHAHAELWHDVACAYRLKEALRERRIGPVDVVGRPCARLHELGLQFEQPVARTTSVAEGVWPAAAVSDR
jgi:hypothetical protein